LSFSLFAQGRAHEALGDREAAKIAYARSRETHLRLDGSRVPHEVDDAIARVSSRPVDVRSVAANNLVDALVAAGAIELAEGGALTLAKTLVKRMPKEATTLLELLMSHEGVADVFCDEETLEELLERFEGPTT
jgi:hypothetical protein